MLKKCYIPSAIIHLKRRGATLQRSQERHRVLLHGRARDFPFGRLEENNSVRGCRNQKESKHVRKKNPRLAGGLLHRTHIAKVGRAGRDI